MPFRKLFIGLFLLLMSCGPSPEALLPFVDGYWQISQVKQDNKVIGEYTISPIVDYWQINEDGTGFRKKVMPNLEGKLIVTQHSAPFTISTADNTLTINYDDNGNSFKEVIVKANENELVITNDQGLVYFYKPYEPIDLSNE